MIGPGGDPLCDADGDPLADGAAVTHVDAPGLRGAIHRQATPTKVTVHWRPVGGLPTPATTDVPAEYLLLVHDQEGADDDR